MAERYAIYYVPPADDPLYLRASAWLGHSIYPGVSMPCEHRPPAALEACRVHTRTAAMYGFHATLKPPFRMKEGESVDALRDAFREFAATQPAFECTPLAVTELGHFLALMPTQPCAELSRLAHDCVKTFDPFRAPLTEAEMRKRNPERLNANQRSKLERWGYPYVLEEFRFHMTLTDRLEDELRDECRRVLVDFLRDVLPGALVIDQLGLCYRGEALGSYVLLETAELAG